MVGPITGAKVTESKDRQPNRLLRLGSFVRTRVNAIGM
jgi:hypothetical protein